MSEKLILCAGPYIYEGFKTLDCNPDYKPDYIALLPPLPREIRDGRWAEIYLIHGIEHFYLWEARELLANMHEALMPGGLMALEQPNLRVAARIMLGLDEPTTDKPEASGIHAIYGDPGYENPWMAHRWGWTPEALREAVIAAGFARERVKTGPAKSRPFAGVRDFRLEATK